MSLEDRVLNYADELKAERLRLQSRVSTLARIEFHLRELTHQPDSLPEFVPDLVEMPTMDRDVAELTSQIAYSVESRTRPGVVHSIRVVDGELVCDCEAGKHGRHCWHVDEAVSNKFLADNYGNPFGNPAVRNPHKEQV